MIFCDVFKTPQIHLKKDVFYVTSLRRLYLKKDVYSGKYFSQVFLTFTNTPQKWFRVTSVESLKYLIKEAWDR